MIVDDRGAVLLRVVFSGNLRARCCPLLQSKIALVQKVEHVRNKEERRHDDG